MSAVIGAIMVEVSMRALSAVVSVALSVLTATALAEEAKPPAEERIRVANQHPFDVAACDEGKITLGGAPDRNRFAIALVLVQPRVLECLTPDEARGPGELTEVRVVARIDDKGASFSASGGNLEPAGAACIAEVLGKAIAIEPLAAGIAPVELAGELVHDKNVHAALELGINAASDWVAAARKAVGGACSCFGAFAAKRPPVLTADVKLVGGKSEVVFRPKTATAESDALAQCLTPILSAVPIPPSDREFRFPLNVIHLHSRDLAQATDLGPELAFQQGDLGRLRLFALAELALVDRTRAGQAFDQAVAAYNKAPKVAAFGGLVDKCDALVAADKTWLGAAEALLAHETRMAGETAALAAKDASWKGAAEAIASAHAATKKEVATATETLAGDEGNCKKLK